MLTKWGKKLIDVQIDSKVIYGIESGHKACIKAKDCAGSDINIGCSHSSITAGNSLLTSLTASGSSSSNGIALGSGTTPATENDYHLENMITSGLSFSASPTITSTFDTATGNYLASVDLTISNSTSNAITISEIAKFVKTYKNSTFGNAIDTSAVNGCCIMVDRTVLETPLTIPANSAAVLRYGFNYKMDSAT